MRVEKERPIAMFDNDKIIAIYADANAVSIDSSVYAPNSDSEEKLAVTESTPPPIPSHHLTFPLSFASLYIL
jgi:hypothetical protein